MKKKTLSWMALALGGALLCSAPGAIAGDKEAPKDTHKEGGKAHKEGGDKPQKEGGKPQKEGEKGDPGENLLKNLTHHLQLSAEQQEKIKPIIADMMAQIKAAKEERAPEKANAARQAGMDKIAEQLTPEQRAKFDKHRAGEGGNKEKKDKGDKPHKEGGDKPHKEKPAA
jgi:hypothetical protein